MKKGICFSLLITLFLQLMFTGCIERKTQSDFASDNKRDYLIYGVKSIPGNLYMLGYEDPEQKNILYMLFSGLVREDEKGNIIPSLAESWGIENDITYTFKLRNDLYWSDGIAITAQDFYNFFKNILKPGFNNKELYELSCIKGAYDYSQGKNDFSSVGIDVKDEKTLVITLEYPCSNFLYTLSQPEYTLKRVDEKASEDILEKWTGKISDIVCSGPFIMGSITKSSSGSRNITLLKNNRYWDTDNTAANKIVISEEQNSESALADFQMGKIDLFLSPPESEIKSLINEKKTYISDYSSASFLFFNLKKDGPSMDINFRKAVNYLISRKDIMSKNNGEIYSERDSFFSDSSAKYFGSADNTVLANELLKEVKNYWKLNIIYDSEDPARKVYEDLISMLREKLKCSINLIALDKTDLESKLKKGDFDIALLKAESGQELLQGGKEFCTFYDNFYLSGLYSSAYNENSYYSRINILNQCEKKLFEDMPFIPLWDSKLVICQDKYVKGMKILKNGYIDFQALHIS